LESLNQIINDGKRVSLATITPEQYRALESFSLIKAKEFISRLSNHVKIEPPSVTVWYGDYDEMRTVAQYTKKQIILRQRTNSDAKIIAATLAHEFCHYYIDLKNLFIDGENINKNERLVDLTAILLGFGEILINGKIRSRRSDSFLGYLEIDACLIAYSDFGELNNISKEELYSGLDIDMGYAKGKLKEKLMRLLSKITDKK